MSNNSSHGPPLKKLRSTFDPDVTVVLGDEEQETRQHHSVVLARHSEYIDTMLASNMIESQTRRLTFPDIPTSVWDTMMRCLEDPVASRKMTADEAVTILPFYKKYLFPKGVDLCESVLIGELAAVKDDANIDTIVDLIDSITTNELSVAIDEAAELLSRCFNTPKLQVQFNKDHIQRLSPIFKESETLQETFNIEPDDTDCSLLPDLVVQKLMLMSARRAALKNGPKHVTVKVGRASHQCRLLEVFDAYWTEIYDGHLMVTRDDDTDDWALYMTGVDEDEARAWISRNSANRLYPPARNWTPSTESAKEEGPVSVRGFPDY